MGTLMLSELEDEIRAGLGNRTDLDARLPRALNIAQTRITRVINWEELQEIYTGITGFTSTPADDKFLALPSSVRKINSVRLLDGFNSRKLIRVQHVAWDRTVPAPQAQAVGRPSMYTQYRNIMEFWKVPDAAYSLECRTVDWPTPFVAASPNAVSDLDNKDDMLISLSLSWLYLTLKNDPMARRWWVTYTGQLNTAMGEELEQPDLDLLPSAGVGSIGASVPYYQDPFVTGV